MTAYWLMFALPALAVFAPVKGSRWVRNLSWFGLACLFVLMIGLRHEVGGDWMGYLEHYEKAFGVPLAEALATNDPAYGALNWFSGLLGTGVYLVNLVCAAVFVAGLWIFIRMLPYPWIALTVATPYLVIVVAMGYTRQAAAIGLVMLGLAQLGQAKVKHYFALVALAALFHKTAVLMFPFGLITLAGRGQVGHMLILGGSLLV